MAIILYPKVEVKSLSFKGVKKLTVPKQCLSLKEIVKRFVRKESLPIAHEGVYEHRFGDLEKLSRGDMFDQLEHAKFLETKIFERNEREKAKDEKRAADKKAADDAAILAKAKDMAKSASPARGPAEGQDGSLRT